jgi:hypothetical protein
MGAVLGMPAFEAVASMNVLVDLKISAISGVIFAMDVEPGWPYLIGFDYIQAN